MAKLEVNERALKNLTKKDRKEEDKRVSDANKMDSAATLARRNLEQRLAKSKDPKELKRLKRRQKVMKAVFNQD